MKRYSTEDKEQILNDLSASGRSRAAFCRDRELSYKRVGGWLRAQAKVSIATNSFARVDLLDERVGECVEVWLDSSVCVRFTAGTAPGMIAAFCREVSGC